MPAEVWQLAIGYVVLGFIVGYRATNKGKSFWRWFGLSLIATPLFGLLMLELFSQTRRAPCYQCKEQVIVGATKCPHCGVGLKWS